MLSNCKILWKRKKKRIPWKSKYLFAADLLISQYYIQAHMHLNLLLHMYASCTRMSWLHYPSKGALTQVSAENFIVRSLTLDPLDISFRKYKKFSQLFPCNLFIILQMMTLKNFLNVYLFLRDRETERERERESMSWGGAERERDTESKAGSRL